jgi:hypothetical protein
MTGDKKLKKTAAQLSQMVTTELGVAGVKIVVHPNLARDWHATVITTVSEDAARDLVGIWCGAISGNMKVSFQAARSIG